MKTFETLLEQHKKTLAMIRTMKFEDIPNHLFKKIEEQSVTLALANADYKCQEPNCQETKNIQSHHIITRHYKKFMTMTQYTTQRHYWANIIILCRRHHDKIHDRPSTNNQAEIGFISLKKIEKAKQIKKTEGEKLK